MRYLLFFFLLLFCTQVSTQEIFQGFYGKSEDDIGYTVVELDTGYVVFGVTHNITAGSNADFLSIIYDKHNETFIQPPLAFTGMNGVTGSVDRIFDVKSIGGNVIIATGETSRQSGATQHQEIMLIKLDYNNLSTTLHAFGDTLLGAEASLVDDRGTAVAITSDGGYLICGQSGTQPLLFKTDSDMNLLWTRSLNITGGGKALDVIENNDGDYLVVGTAKRNNPASYDMFLYRFEDDGDFIDGAFFGFETSDQDAQSIIQTADNGYLITGNTNAGTNSSSILLIKLAGDFSPEWAYTYNSGGKDEATQAIEAIEGNGYVVTGGTSQSGGSNGLFLRVANNGDFLRSRIYGGDNNELIHAMTRTSDNSYFFAGYANSFGIAPAEVYTVKTNIYGHSGAGCPQDSVSFTRDFAAFALNSSTANPQHKDLHQWNWNYDPMASAFLPTYRSAKICNDIIPPLQAFAGENDTICTGETIQLGDTGRVATGGTQPYEFEWMPGNLTDTKPVVSPAASTTYYLKVTDMGGQTARDTVHIEVKDLSANFSGLNPEYCTSSPMSILTPDTLEGYFTGPGTNWNGSDWYFNPQEAGAGTYSISYMNLCDTSSQTTTVHPAPCFADVVTDTTAGSVSVPQGLFTYCDGTIYITNFSNITRIDTFGVAVRIAGHPSQTGYKDDQADSARLTIPSGIVVMEDKTIYIADNSNHSIRKLKNDTVTTIAGSAPPNIISGTVDHANGLDARFNAPYGITYDPVRNCLYVTQQTLIRKIDLTDPAHPVSTIAGGGSWDVTDAVHADSAHFYRLRHISLHNDYLYFPDREKRVVYRLDLNTDTVIRYAGVYDSPGNADGPRLSGKFGFPVGISVNCNGDVYISDEFWPSMREVRKDILYTFDDPNGMLNEPQGISVFVKGFIDIANKGNNNILRMTIEDWEVGPWVGLDTADFTYCLGAATDTLEPLYDCGSYTGPGISQLVDGRYIFTPPGTTGEYTITYHYEIGYCSEQTSTTIRVVDNPVLVMPDTVGICAGASARLYSTEEWQSHLWSTGATNDTILVNTEDLYWLEVSDTNNCYDRDSTYVLARPNPTVEAGSITPVCPGESFTLGGSPSASGGEEPYTYEWTPALYLNDSTLANPTGSITSPNIFHLHVIDRFFCEGEDSVQVDLSANPFAIAGTNDSICEGETSTLGGSPTGPPGASYAWSNDTYLNDAGTANPEATPPSGTTQFIVTVTDGGCEAWDTTYVTVYKNPIANAGPNDTLCSDGSVVIGNMASGGTFPYTYAWSPATGLNDPSLATPVASPSLQTTYTVTVTDANGCEDNDEMTLYISNISIAAGADTNLCEGESVNIGNNATNGYAPYTYSWSPGTGIDDPNIATPVASPGTTTQYVVLATDAAGCEANDTIQIDVHPLPTAAVAFTDSSTCVGDTIQLIALGGDTYSWSPNTYIISPNTATPLVFPMDTTRYIVNVTDINSCTDTASVIIRVNNPDVFITPYPDTMICEGASVQLSASAPAGINYAWSPVAGLDDPNIATPIATPATTTTYTVSANTSLGCPAMDTVRIIVSVGLTANAGANDTICTGLSTTLGGDTVASGGLPGYTYLWSTGDVVETPTVTPGAASEYTITVTDLANCTASDTVFIGLWPLPSVDAGLRDTICYGDSTDIGGSPTAGGTIAPYTYDWSPAINLHKTDTSNPIAFSDNTGTSNLTTTYHVVVTDGRGCSESDDVDITFLPQPQTNYDFDSICLGETDTLKAYGGTDYTWQPMSEILTVFDNKAVISPDTTTHYEVIIASAFCDPDTLDVTIKVNPVPVVVAGPDTSIFIGETVQLYASGGVSYLWSPAAGLLDPANTQNPMAQVISTTHFIVIATNIFNCPASDTVHVEVRDKFDIFVPNAFAPSGDVPENRKVCVNGVGIERIDFKIFNKWGEMVFSTTDIETCWDGTYKGRLQDMQTFGYFLEVEDYHGNIHTEKGSIVLIK